MNRRIGSPKAFEKVIIREKEDPYNPTLAQMLNITIRYLSGILKRLHMFKWNFLLQRKHDQFREISVTNK